MYSSQIKRQLTDMPCYPRTPGFQINVGAWSKPQAKGTASPSTLSMLANRGTKPQISTLETSKLETSSSENVSLKNVEFVNASLVWPFWATVFIASFMLYVHSSKAEEFDLKTGILFQSIHPQISLFWQIVTVLTYYFVSLHELLCNLLMKFVQFSRFNGRHLCHGGHVLLDKTSSYTPEVGW